MGDHLAGPGPQTIPGLTFIDVAGRHAGAAPGEAASPATGVFSNELSPRPGRDGLPSGSLLSGRIPPRLSDRLRAGAIF